VFNIKNKFNTKDRGTPKSAGPVAVATFATIVNPALSRYLAYSTRTGVLNLGKFYLCWG